MVAKESVTKAEATVAPKEETFALLAGGSCDLYGACSDEEEDTHEAVIQSDAYMLLDSPSPDVLETASVTWRPRLIRIVSSYLQLMRFAIWFIGFRVV